MKLVTNIDRKPLLKLEGGEIINLNTLKPIACETIPVRIGKELKISKHKNKRFIDKAQKYFKVQKISKQYGTVWYKLESQMVLFCIVQGENVQLIGNYPIYYLKLLYRFITHFNCFGSPDSLKLNLGGGG